MVKVNGIEYLGGYKAASGDGYTPGELAPGDPIWVGSDGDRMFVRRRNGHDLVTTIVNRAGCDPQTTR